MRTVLFLVQKEFLQVFRDRLMLLMVLVLPPFLTVVLSFAANYEIKNLSLGVVDHDLSPLSRQLVAKFAASGYFKVKVASFSAREADASLAKDQTDLILEIPPHFERDVVRENNAAVSVTVNAIDAVKGRLAIGYAGSIIQSFAMDGGRQTADGGPLTVDGLQTAQPFDNEGPPSAAGLEPSAVHRLPSTVYRPPSAVHRPPSAVQVTYSNWYNPRLDYKTFMVPGILIIVISMITCSLTAMNVVREREIGTIEQINVTPVHKWQFILGKLLPVWLLTLVMMTVGLVSGWLIFRIPILGDLRLVFFYTLAYAPCMPGIGFLIANFAVSQQQAMFTAWFFLLIFALMCGLFTTIDSMPEWAQYLNMINPVKYAVEFIRLVLLKGAGFADIRQNLPYWGMALR
ncbi:MAG: ABC transporter permease [Thermoanaerobaculia bacterium]|nr:ABC transporter permease [Thermoanaerobaculia bacterium]